MSYNPFRFHSKKDRSVSVYMKINKPASGNWTAINTSLQDMKKAMEELSKVVSEHKITDVLMAVLSAYPNPLSFSDHPDSSIDTESFQFQIRTLIEVWGAFPIPAFIERNFNEAEDIDQHYLNALIASRNPDEVLSVDMLVKLFRDYFDRTYQIPDSEMFHSFNGYTMEQKDYFLPALKVLNWDKVNEVFWSPVYYTPWYDNQLSAGHLIRNLQQPDVTHRDHLNMDTAMVSCDCGIYASANLSELGSYFSLPDNQSRSLGMDIRYRREDRRLCIIEPFSDATVWMARKGWKTSKAFISEIVGDTISVKDASELMSMVWRRRLDLTSIFENKEMFQ